MFSAIGGAFSYVYQGIFYRPLYNGLVFLIAHLPGGDVGAAIILFTIFVRLVLYPLSKSSLKSQRKMRELQPAMEKIKVEFKDNKEEQAKRTMALYSENNVNPFSGILFLFIQIPLIIALYQVFLRGGLPIVNAALLYSFVHVPALVSMQFLGIVNVASAHNIPLALLAAISQYFQAKYTLPPAKPKSADAKASFQDDFTRGLGLQMKYMLPIFIGFFAYGVAGAVALYWITNNLFSIAQELMISREAKKAKK